MKKSWIDQLIEEGLMDEWLVYLFDRDYLNKPIIYILRSFREEKNLNQIKTPPSIILEKQIIKYIDNMSTAERLIHPCWYVREIAKQIEWSTND